MQQYEREFFISRICSGYIRYPELNIKLIHPSIDLLYESQEIYSTTLRNAIESNVLTQEEVLYILRDNCEWDDKKEEELEEILPKHVEHWKMEYYNSFFNLKEKEKNKLYLTTALSEIDRLFSIKHSFDYLTTHGVATFARHQFIIENTAKNMDGTTHDWNDLSISLVMDYMHKSMIDETSMRELCRNEPWRSIWTAGKRVGSLFGKPAIELTEEQKRLVSWSSLYDNISEYSDSPPQVVIDDDIALDGWMLIKNRDAEKEKNKNNIESRLSKSKAANAPEVYYVVSDDDKAALFSRSEASKVYDMNDPMSRNIVKQRIDMVQKHGQINDLDMPDMKQKVRVATTAAIDAARKSRGG